MPVKYTAIFFSLVCATFCNRLNAQDDDCHIDLEDAGVTARITESLDSGGKTQLSIMFSNSSKNNYEVPVVRVVACEFMKNNVLLPELASIKAGESITQSYLCGAGFRDDSVAVKMYLKEPGDETATSACTTISPQSQQESHSQQVLQNSQMPVEVQTLATSNVNILNQQLYQVVVTSLVPEVEINNVLINQNTKCNDNDYIEKTLSGRVRTKFKMGEKKTITTPCDPVEIVVKTNQGDFSFRSR